MRAPLVEQRWTCAKLTQPPGTWAISKKVKDLALRNRLAKARFLFAAAIFSGTLTGTLMGCGSGAGDFCNKARTCERGNDADEEACNRHFDELAQIADLRNCSNERDDYDSCIRDNARCKDHSYGTQDDKLCALQEDRLTKCLK